MLSNDKPMSNRSQRTKDSYDRSDYQRAKESDNTGGEVEVTRYRDGSSTVHWGGPCSPTNYDANGEEC